MGVIAQVFGVFMLAQAGNIGREGGASSREGDNSTKPELNDVQSTTRGTNAHGNPVPVSFSKKSIASPGKDNEDAGSSSAESVHIKSASDSDSHYTGY